MTSFLPRTLSVSQMQALCQEITPHLLGATVWRCQAFNDRRLLIQLNTTSGKHETLFICLQEPFLRFHLLHQSDLYSEKKSLHSLNSTLSGCTFESMEVVNLDRILRLSFKAEKTRYTLIVEFFPKHPNYYLLDSERRILSALYPLEQAFYQLPPSHPLPDPSHSVILTNDELEKLYNEHESCYFLEKGRQDTQNLIQKQLKRLQQRIHKLEKDYQACLNWEAIQHEGDLLKSYFSQLKKGMATLTVWDWLTQQQETLELDPTLTPQETLAIRFKRSKKLQLGLSHTKDQLDKALAEKQKWQILLDKLDQIQTQEAWLQFEKEHAHLIKQVPSVRPLVKKVKKVPLPYHEYVSATGFKIWVGKTAKDNEKLTFQLSNGSDWWLHVKDFPGSHVIIRTPRGQEPDPETLADAAQLALYYSKAKDRGEAEICVTQRKFVSRLGKSRTGQVQISKHKTRLIKWDVKRYQLLKARRDEASTLRL